jgi:hypothetical protein
MARDFVDQKGLAYRWGVSERTLERWRFERRGPRYLKLVGKVVYRLADIEAFEAESVQEGDQSCRRTADAAS